MDAFVKYVEDSGVDFKSLSNEEKRKWRANYDSSQKGSSVDRETIKIIIDEVIDTRERRRSRDRTEGSDRARKRDQSPAPSTPSPEIFRITLIDRAVKHKWAIDENKKPKKRQRKRSADEKKDEKKDEKGDEKKDEEEDKKQATKISCDFCEEWMDPIFIEAAHVIPKKEVHREIVRKRIRESSFVGLDDFLSINSSINGLMLCKSCHTEFDRLPPDLDIDEKGQRVYTGGCAKRRKLHGKPARWWGVPGYPNKLVFQYREEVQKEVDGLKFKKEYPKMTVELLRAELRSRDLSPKGLKPELIERLQENDETMGKYIDEVRE